MTAADQVDSGEIVDAETIEPGPQAGATVAVATPRPAGALALYDSQSTWTMAQRASLAQLGLSQAPDGDLAVFLHVCQKTGLDPFARQIYMIARNDRQAESGVKWTIQTGIDGFRVVAQRSGEYRGQTPVQWCGEDGQWRDVWLNPKVPPAAARVGVHREGYAEPIYAVALFHEYAQTKYNGGYTKMWAEKGAVMIAKCAEALALRKAFPQDLSGIYTSDEMAMADSEQGPPRAPAGGGGQVVDADPGHRQQQRRPSPAQQASARTAPQAGPPRMSDDEFARQVVQAERTNDLPALRALYVVVQQAGDGPRIESVLASAALVRPRWEADEAQRIADAQQLAAHAEWLAQQQQRGDEPPPDDDEPPLFDDGSAEDGA